MGIILANAYANAGPEGRLIEFVVIASITLALCVIIVGMWRTSDPPP